MADGCHDDSVYPYRLTVRVTPPLTAAQLEDLRALLQEVAATYDEPLVPAETPDAP